MALTRSQLYVKPDGENLELVVGRQQTLTFIILNADRQRRDLSDGPDVLDVVAKALADGSVPVFSFVAQANQSTTGKGKADLVCPAAQLTVARVGEIVVDLGVNDEVLGAYTVQLVASDAE